MCVCEESEGLCVCVCVCEESEGLCVCVCVCVCEESEGQSSMVHGAKERREERRERVELPDSLMYEAVLRSAGPGLETPQSPP